MTTLLDALLRNESGGRNIPNVHQGTSSGQAQGYFQITTGTWDAFGGRQYAVDPLHATYEQQADIASRIPLKRWDESTLRAMQATGKPINPNATLGQNLAANGESFGSARHVGGAGSGGGYFAGGAPTAATTPGSAISDLGDALFPSPRAPTSYDLSSGDSSPLTTSDGGGATSSLDAAGVGEEDFISPPPDFRPSTPSEAPPGRTSTPGPAAAEAQGDTGLADLFKVKDIGLARRTNPKTGGPLLRPGWKTRG